MLECNQEASLIFIEGVRHTTLAFSFKVLLLN
jgi:hypothetical protein